MPKKILLADDSITIQKVVELTFSDGDYEVVATNNGNKAIQRLAEIKPDIILSDIIMPEKNGYELCEYVKSHPEFRSIPVILLTGTFEPFDPDRAEKAGCDAVITKPFESQSLIHKVEELIQQKSGGAQAVAAAPKESEPRPASDLPERESGGWPVPKLDIGWSSPAPAKPEPGESFSTTDFTPPAAATAPPLGSAKSSAFEEHGEDLFGAPAAAQQPSKPEFEEKVPSDTATRAFPRMSFEEIQRKAAETAPEADSGATKAFPRMSFEDLQRLSAGTKAPAEPEEAPLAGGWTPPAEAAPAEEWASPDADTLERSSPVTDSSPFGEEPPAPPVSAASDSIFDTPESEHHSWPTSPPVSPPDTPAREAEATPGQLSDEQIDQIARRVVQLMSEQVVRNIAWEVIPDLAEMVVRERIRQLESET